MRTFFQFLLAVLVLYSHVSSACHPQYSEYVLINLRTQLHRAGALRPHNGKRDFVLPVVLTRAGTWSYVGCYT